MSSSVSGGPKGRPSPSPPPPPSKAKPPPPFSKEPLDADDLSSADSDVVEEWEEYRPCIMRYITAISRTTGVLLLALMWLLTGLLLKKLPEGKYAPWYLLGVSILVTFFEVIWMVNKCVVSCMRQDGCCCMFWRFLVWIDVWRKTILYLIFAIPCFLAVLFSPESIIAGLLLIITACVYFIKSFKNSTCMNRRLKRRSVGKTPSPRTNLVAHDVQVGAASNYQSTYAPTTAASPVQPREGRITKSRYEPVSSERRDSGGGGGGGGGGGERPRSPKESFLDPSGRKRQRYTASPSMDNPDDGVPYRESPRHDRRFDDGYSPRDRPQGRYDDRRDPYYDRPSRYDDRDRDWDRDRDRDRDRYRDRDLDRDRDRDRDLESGYRRSRRGRYDDDDDDEDYRRRDHQDHYRREDERYDDRRVPSPRAATGRRPQSPDVGTGHHKTAGDQDQRSVRESPQAKPANVASSTKTPPDAKTATKEGQGTKAEDTPRTGAPPAAAKTARQPPPLKELPPMASQAMKESAAANLVRQVSSASPVGATPSGSQPTGMPSKIEQKAASMTNPFEESEVKKPPPGSNPFEESDDYFD